MHALPHIYWVFARCRCTWHSRFIFNKSPSAVHVFSRVDPLDCLAVAPKLIFNPNSVTRGNNYRLFKQSCHYDLRKFSFTNRIVNIWNSLSNTVVEADTVDKFKLRLDKFWMYQDIKYDFTAALTGTGD